MISKFEDALLRCNKPKVGFRDRLFDFLDDGVSLRRLRAVSKVLHALVDHQAGRLFRELKITAPLDERRNVNSLEIILPYCQNLTVIVSAEKGALPTDPEPRSSVGNQDSASSKKHKLTPLSPRYMKRREERIMYESMTRALAVVPPIQLPPEEQVARYTTRERWLSIFSRCHQLQRLTLRVNGDPSWPGRTKVEDTVIDIRTSIEKASLPKVREVRIVPVHAMGIIHLRWAGFNSFGTPLAANKLSMVWARLDILDLQLRNPLVSSSGLMPLQQTMFKKVLYDYLRSFTPTLRSLRFVWLDGIGPSPLTLHLEPELELKGRPALEWQRLEEAWLCCVTFPKQAMQLASALAPKLERLFTLRATQRDSSMNLGDRDAWFRVPLDKGKSNVLVWTDTASSIYSQSARSSGYELGEGSRTSKVVPSMSGLTWRPPPRCV